MKPSPPLGAGARAAGIAVALLRAVTSSTNQTPAASFSLRDRRVAEHLPLARRLALRLSTKVPSTVDVDDLISAGTEGLLDAASKYNATRGVPFEAYARTRINGAMVDMLRADDHATRSERRRERAAGAAERSMRRELGRELTSEEQSGLRGGTAPALARARAFVTLDDCGDVLEQTVAIDAFEALSRSQTRARLVEAIRSLAEREQTILSLYYQEELTYREIGAALGVTESRVCQVLRSIHATLRERLTGQEDGAGDEGYDA